MGTCQPVSYPNKSCCAAQITFRQPRRTNNKKGERNKNVHFHPPQKQRTAPQPSKGGGASTAVLSPCRDLRQDLVRWRRHPWTLHDRTEDGEEGVTAWQSRRR